MAIKLNVRIIKEESVFLTYQSMPEGWLSVKKIVAHSPDTNKLPLARAKGG